MSLTHGLIRSTYSIGAMAFLVKPIRREQMAPTLALATSLFREGQFLRRALAERKIIEQAKGRLMERQRTTEDAAFCGCVGVRWIRGRGLPMSPATYSP